MVLSNSEIVRCLDSGAFKIDGLAGRDPSQSPFNTSAVDLRLSSNISVPKPDENPVQLDLTRGRVAKFFTDHSDHRVISEDQPWSLKPGKFLLASTKERVDFAIHPGGPCYAARVEGKSSLARCGILIHFTAPTIHAGFAGTITLEMINLGPYDFLLTPGIFVCQLVIEEVKGVPVEAPNQFKGQSTPAGR